jgi:hypothetical protein
MVQKAWTLSTVDEQAFRVFEWKILRRVYGPVCIQGELNLRTNPELDHLLGHADLVRFVKSRRLSWLGHVERMEEKRMPKKILKDICTVEALGEMTSNRTLGRWE